MLRLILALMALPHMAFACDTPVCVVDPSTLELYEIITFEDEVSHMGPGRNIDGVLDLDGASFAERFEGQTLTRFGDHDVVQDLPTAPLTLQTGGAGQNLSLVYMRPTNVLNGYGMAGFPKREAQGEGAIAVLFDRPQGVFAFQLRGGEAGRASVRFFDNAGREIDRATLDPVGEGSFGFVSQRPVAGFVITNEDPQGLALDNLAFAPPPQLG